MLNEESIRTGESAKPPARRREEVEGKAVEIQEKLCACV